MAETECRKKKRNAPVVPVSFTTTMCVIIEHNIPPECDLRLLYTTLSIQWTTTSWSLDSKNCGTTIIVINFEKP